MHPPTRRTRNDWATLKTLLPYLWVYKWRDVARAGLPDRRQAGQRRRAAGAEKPHRRLTINRDAAAGAAGAAAGRCWSPTARCALSTTLFTELREFLFARVTQRAVRTIALQVFRHLHALSLRFHLNRQTGGMTRDIERGTRGISLAGVVHAVQHPADPGRDHAGAGLPGAALRHLVHRSSPPARWSPTSPSPSSSPNGARISGAR